MRTDHATSQPGHDDWREADQQLRRLAARRAALDADEARWLLVARATRVHEYCGFGSFVEYCERILGYRPHTTRERLRVAEALVELPAITRALAHGELSYSAVRELTRVATADTERAWLDACAGRTIGEIESLVSGHEAGDLPDDPADPGLEPRVLQLALTPDVYAMFLETRRRLRDETGGDLDDSDVIAELCTRAAAAGASPDRAPFQLAITVCPRCDRATEDGAGQVIDVAPEALALARCDADHVHADGSVTTEIPRAVRRAVRRRDHGRCAIPGCRNARYLHLHHIVPREQGGAHTPENLILLCTAHHRAVHDHRIRITGRAPTNLQIEHRDGARYGHDASAAAKQTLTGLGFTAQVASAAVARAASRLGRDVPLELFLRECLRECPRPTG